MHLTHARQPVRKAGHEILTTSLKCWQNKASLISIVGTATSVIVRFDGSGRRRGRTTTKRTTATTRACGALYQALFRLVPTKPLRRSRPVGEWEKRKAKGGRSGEVRFCAILI